MTETSGGDDAAAGLFQKLHAHVSTRPTVDDSEGQQENDSSIASGHLPVRVFVQFCRNVSIAVNDEVG